MDAPRGTRPARADDRRDDPRPGRRGRHFAQVVAVNRRIVASGRLDLVLDPDVLARTYGGHLLVARRPSASCSTTPTTTTQPAAPSGTSTTDAPSGRGCSTRSSTRSRFPFFVRALVAAAIVGLVCAVVGSYMVLRGLAFMGDALSHSAFPGVVVGVPAEGPVLPRCRDRRGRARRSAIGWVTRRGQLRGDTAIGVLFAGMFALGVFLFSLDPELRRRPVRLPVRRDPGDRRRRPHRAVASWALVVLGIVAILWKEFLYSTFDPLGAAAAGPAGRPRSTTCSWP